MSVSSTYYLGNAYSVSNGECEPQVLCPANVSACVTNACGANIGACAFNACGANAGACGANGSGLAGSA